MGYQTLVQSRSGAVATITLNRPEARNALDMVMRRELAAILDEVEADEGARVLILTGAADTSAPAATSRRCATSDRRRPRAGRASSCSTRWFNGMVNFPKPTIAMVRRPTRSARPNLALCCDLSSRRTARKFGRALLEDRVWCPTGGTARGSLPRGGRSRSRQGADFTAGHHRRGRAERIGLVNRVVRWRTRAERRVRSRKDRRRSAGRPQDGQAHVNARRRSDLSLRAISRHSRRAIAIASDDHPGGSRRVLREAAAKFTGR